GIIGEYFLTLEFVQENDPNFVEDIIRSYFKSSADFMDQLQQILNTEPLDLKNLERLIYKVKGGCGSMGAAKLHTVSGEMLDLFKAREFHRLHAAFGRVKAELAILKMHLETYAELLGQLRMTVPPDEGSDNQEDVESTASNDVNGN
ncbi:histidine-containing phosphotransfer protein 1, partial [Bienertia sinuspersici]